jgi:hypothetical protein
MSHPIQVNGTVRISETNISPQGDVRVFIRKGNEMEQSRKFQASKIAQAPGIFSFTISTEEEYHYWAEWGHFHTHTFALLIQSADSETHPVQLQELLFP